MLKRYFVRASFEGTSEPRLGGIGHGSHEVDARKNCRYGAGGRTRTDMRSEPRQILSLVRIPISPLRRRRMHMIRPFRMERNFTRPNQLAGPSRL